MWKKIIASVIAASLLLSFAGCSTEETGGDQGGDTPPVAEGLYTAGTYTGTTKGHNADLTVTVTLEADKIAAVEVTEHAESAGIADGALERMPTDIVEYQSLGIDTVAGATVTSTAIIEATKIALESAGVDTAALMEAVSVEEGEGETVELSADVVVIGGGGAGLAAAVTAIDNGSDVIVIEKMATLGGSTIMAGGQFNAVDTERQANLEMRPELIDEILSYTEFDAVNDTHQRLMDELAAQVAEYQANGSTHMFDSPQLHALQAFVGGDLVANIDMLETYAYGAEEAVAWLESLGVEFYDEVGTVTGALWSRTHMFVKPLTTAPIEAYREILDASGDKVKILMETKAYEIIMEDGRAVGVKATQGNDEYVITANNGVVLATGGFAKNNEMVVANDTRWGNLKGLNSTNSVSATGDGIEMAQSVGANLVGMEHIQLLPVGHPETGGMQGNIAGNAANQLFINLEGERFVAEDERRDVLTEGLLAQTDQVMWILVNATEYPTPETTNDFNEQIGDLVANGTAVMGNTIEEVAIAMNVDPVALQATIDDYNAVVRGEKEDDFGKNLLLDEFNTPPYYASIRVPTIHHTMGGVEINELAQVLTADGEAIPSLYAAGEVTGGIHGANRLGGNAIPDTVVFGRIAGQSAAMSK